MKYKIDALKELTNNGQYAHIFNWMGLSDEDDAGEIYDTIVSIQENGLSGGVHGFIYTQDILYFFDNYKEEVAKYFDEFMPDDFGQLAIDGCVTPFDVIKQTPKFITAMVFGYVEGTIYTINTEDFVEEE